MKVRGRRVAPIRDPSYVHAPNNEFTGKMKTKRAHRNVALSLTD
ncbi:hypothetical protein RB2083_990 [Rhodobacteraceae bacterium HTCC2083]|nr:hypothetical protein RB2083_990 [Rhodobacteraceae bacterium HTCC2083]